MIKFILVAFLLVATSCEDRPDQGSNLCLAYCSHISRWAEACGKPPISIASCERALWKNTNAYGECWQMHLEWQPNAEDDCSRIPRLQPMKYVRDLEEKK